MKYDQGYEELSAEQLGIPTEIDNQNEDRDYHDVPERS